MTSDDEEFWSNVAFLRQMVRRSPEATGEDFARLADRHGAGLETIRAYADWLASALQFADARLGERAAATGRKVVAKSTMDRAVNAVVSGIVADLANLPTTAADRRRAKIEARRAKRSAE